MYEIVEYITENPGVEMVINFLMNGFRCLLKKAESMNITQTGKILINFEFCSHFSL